jgi:PadR family transcriptional regulator PadR
MARQTNPDFLNGVPELLVLQLLARRAMYGYELVRAIEESSGQVLEFGEGCIYPILHRLESDGDLASRRETVGGRSRVVYRLTASGKKRLQARVAAWRSIVGAVDQVLQGAKHGKPALS